MRLRLLPCLLLLLATACDRPTSPAADPMDRYASANGLAGRSVTPGTSATAVAATAHGLGGIYQGMLPCADCAGIETVLYLYPDSTYLERRTYLDQLKDGDDGQVSAGRWVQVSATLVRLTRRSATSPTDYRLRNNGLQQLDLDGQEITGNLASRYFLAHVASF